MSDLSGRLSGSQAISGSLSGGSVLRGGLSMGGGVSPELLLDKADVITDTASGSIVSISDGMASPVLGLSVDIEPIQDLHGYDNPWPAGGGKNIIPTTLSLLKDKNTGGTWSNNAYEISGVTFTVNDNGTITVNGTSTAAIYFNFIQSSAASRLPITAGTYILHKTGSSDINISVGKDGGYWGAATTSDTTVTTDSDVGLSAYSYIASGKTLSNFVLKPMFEKGSTASAWQPYSNICPISGRSEVSVTRTGNNMFGGELFARAVEAVAYAPQFSINTEEKTFTFTRSSVYDGSYERVIFTPKEPTRMTAVITYSNYGNNNSMLFSYSDGTEARLLLNNTNGVKTTYVFDSGSKLVKYVAMNYYGNALTTVYYDESGFFNGAVTASDFEAYNGVSILIPLGQTVYGGTVDVTEGKLTITHKTKVADGTNVKVAGIYADSTAYTDNIPDMYNDSSYAHQRDVMVLCDKLKASAYITIGSTPYGVSQNGGRRFIFNIQDLTTVAQYNAWLQANTPTVYYLLADPIEVTLTAEELDILFGVNNIWADSGDTAVEYRADTKLWILKKIAQALNA